MTFTTQLLGFLRRAGTERSTPQVIAEMFQFVGAAFTVRRVSLHLADPDTGDLSPYVSQFVSGEQRPELYERWRAFDIEDADLTRRFRGGARILLVEDPIAGDLLPQTFVDGFDIGPFLAVALRRGEDLEGLLVFEGPLESLRDHQDEAVEFAGYLALALDNARAFEREQERAAEAEALVEVGDVLSRTTDLGEVLVAVTRQCASVTGFERCSVFLVDHDRDVLVPTMSQFADGHTDQEAWERFRTLEAELPIASRVLRTGEPAIIEDPRRHPELDAATWLEPFGIETLLLLPLSAWGERFGVLELDHRRHVPVTERQLRIARAVAAQGAVAIGVSRALDRERVTSTELERANRAKDELLAMVSHELRAPLTSIRGFADLLEHHADDLAADQREEMARRIQANTDRQIALIDGLLRSDRLASGEVSVDRQRVELRGLVTDIVTSVGLDGSTVEIRVDDQHRTLADPEHVRHVIANLLVNADRYGAPPIEVHSAVHEDEGTVTIEVRDHGPGVPESFAPRLFDRFTQAVGEGSPGVGLGLSIARQMARANDGDLVYEPREPGAGFVLTLPVAR